MVTVPKSINPMGCLLLDNQSWEQYQLISEKHFLIAMRLMEKKFGQASLAVVLGDRMGNDEETLYLRKLVEDDVWNQ